MMKTGLIKMTFIVGLTGGIASGKTTVANLFEALGVCVIDADSVARQLIAPKGSLEKAVIDHFGSEITDKAGHIDREALKAQIFSDDAERIWLGELMHPVIRQTMLDQARQVNTAYCLFVIPLLIENLPYDELNRILVIDCPEKTQSDRLIHRDHINAALATKMIECQTTRENRLSYADDVIENTGDLNALASQVSNLHTRLLVFASS
jgi:dephospho-CoA kinase